MLKRGILVMFILVLLSCIVIAADRETFLDLTLSKFKYGPEQVFDGILSLELEDKVNADENLVFKVNNNPISISFKELFEQVKSNSKLDVIPPKLEKISTLAEYNTNFANDESRIFAVIDLAKADKINSITFKVSGSADDVTLDWTGDGASDWRYIGDPIGGDGGLGNLNHDYLKSFSATTSLVHLLPKKDKYCERVTLNASSEYWINAKAQRLDSNAKLIGAVYVKDQIPIANCNPEEEQAEGASCCALNPTATLETARCQLTNVKQTKDTTAYLCVYAQWDEESEIDLTKSLFNLASEENTNDLDSSAVKRMPGKAQQNIDDRDYLIWGQYRKYNTKLASAKQEVNIIGKDLDIKNYPLRFHAKRAGDIKISDLNANIIESTDYLTKNDFDIVEELPLRYDLKEKVNLSLKYLDNLLTPVEYGEDYEITAKFNGEESEEETFDVVEGPKAVISITNYGPAVGQSIGFDALSSTPFDKDIQKIAKYEWDFGDGYNASASKTSHSYVKPGKYNVTLTVIDEIGISGRAKKTIIVKDISAILPQRVAEVMSATSELKARFTSADAVAKDTIAILGFDKKLEQALANLTIIKNKVGNNPAESEMISLNNELNDIYDAMPTSLVVNKISYPGKITDFSETPIAKKLTLADIPQFKEKLYLAQQNLNVNAEIRLISMTFGSNPEIKAVTLVKKSLSAEGNVYENMPATLSPEFILPLTAQQTAPGSYDLGSASEIIYTLQGDYATTATQAITVVVPANLNNLDAGGVDSGFTCGDGICYGGETKASCPQDCKPSLWWVAPLIISIILLLIALFYVFLYKGPKNFKEVFGLAESRELFRTEKDHQAIKDYAIKALAKGMTKMQITAILSSKGWTKAQVALVIDEARKDLRKKK